MKTVEQESLLGRLIAAEVDFILVGGFAAVAHGSTLVTFDVDVLLHFTEENLTRLQTAMEGLKPVHRMSAGREPLDVRRYHASEWRNIYLKTTAGVLDCQGEVKGLGGYAETLPVSEVREYPFGKCRILTLSALIQAKEAMGRPHDLLTAEQLRAIRERQC